MSWPQVGRYVVGAPIGKGGAGEVYRARAPDGAPVALKLMRSAAGNDRFARECRVQAELALDGGFVRILDAGQSPYGAFLVMPLLGGGTLRDRLRQGPLEPAEVLRVGRALAAALGRAHARGFLHRDIKPENVLFDDDQPLHADLGLAKHLAGDAHLGLSRSLSATGDVRGTIGYLAPECVQDSKHADPRADVFSLGAVLYECATGAPAFEAASLLEVLARVATGRYVPIRALRPDVPEDLARTIERCLDGVPARRFADGAALERALRLVARRGRRAAPASRRLVLGALSLTGAAGVVGLALHLHAARAAAAAAAEAAAVASTRAVVREREAAIAEAARVIELAREGVAPEEQDAQLAKVAALETDEAVGLFMRGMARSRRGDLAGARDDLDRAVELGASLPREIRGRVHAARAAVRRRQGDLGGCQADLRVALATTPDDPLAWAELAEACLEAGQIDQAHEAATQALARDPRLGRALLSRSGVYAARRDFRRALADAHAALEADPTLVEARLFRGMGRLILGEPAGAEEDLSVFLDRRPDHREARVARADARLARGEVALAIADYDLALNALDEPQTRLKRARALDRYGDAPRSDADFEAAAAQGLVARALTERMALRAQRGDLAGALADADRLVTVSPREPGPRLARSAVLERRGDRAGALAEGREALRLAAPGSTAAETARALLRRLGEQPPP